VPLSGPLCHYNHTRFVGSSSRDVVFFYASDLGPGLLLAVKSPRSSGSLCRFILFAPLAFRPEIAFFSEFRVELVTHDPDPARPFVPHMLRYACEILWLEAHAGAVDRVLHSDTFDVFFRGIRLPLTFVVEPHCIRSCGWNPRVGQKVLRAERDG
jgi:hypothetical protein